MTPLDLTKRPPRSPKEELDGLAMLPRTIDKMRATLPGGNPGQYRIKGFSSRLLDSIGVSEEDFREAVGRAATDEDVAKWLRERADVSKYAEITKTLRARSMDDIKDKAAFAERYPIIKRRPDLYYHFDVLEADDAAMFTPAQG